MTEDFLLLQRYVKDRSQEAFAELVSRYLGLVYASARRQVHQSHLAEDVAQAVFLRLAKKAASMSETTVLSSWLLSATRYLASNANRVESRRRHHEQRAASMHSELSDAQKASEMEPVLDETLARLPTTHRDVLMLRFFESRSIREVAEVLKLSEEAAKQRISRAIRQLRAALEDRGVNVAPTVLPALLLSLGKATPPAALMNSIVAAACKAPSGLALLSSIQSKIWIRYAAAVITLIGCVALVAVAMHQSPSPRPGGLVYSVADMDQVQVEANQTYLKIPQGMLWYDVYKPAKNPPASGWPVVVLIHGGPIAITAHPKDWPVYQDYGRVLGAAGFAAVTFNYRFTRPDGLATAEGDVTKLLEVIRADAKRLSIDPDRICLWAFSGGGPQLSFAIRQRPSHIRCLVSFYAVLDAPSGLEKYSPLAQCLAGKGELPPMFIAQMGQDEAAINRSVDTFIEAAKRRGPPPQVVNYAEGFHAFDIEQNTDDSRKVIRSAIEFIKKHLVEK